ncbi:hypothetical protein CBER1_11013 [Cercospora berteroae]|uniref:Uncharacterized protein n=1 Tax=Cercospora berteroae TaxID=357750 RepID=A0A2S6BZA6_9PEZI|nr:hypothetical protein CBER1_11013 [Cercospora berteroae]
MNNGDLTTVQGKDYQLYWKQRFLPGLSNRGIGKVEQWADLLDRIKFNVIPPEEVTFLNGLVDNLCAKSPNPVARGFKELFTQLLVTVDAAPARLVQPLENNLSRQFEIHTMNQTRLDQTFDKVHATHDELRAMFDKPRTDEVINNRIKGLFTPVKTDNEKNWQAFKSSMDKKQRDYEANLNGRIDNTTKKECLRALEPHLKELDDAKEAVASLNDDARKTADTLNNDLQRHVTDAGIAFTRLKQQQESIANDLEKQRKNHTDYVLSNSTDFHDLRTTVQKHDKTMTDLSEAVRDHAIVSGLDEAIKKINKNIELLRDEGIKIFGGLQKISRRSKENREVLAQILIHTTGVEQVAVKLEQTLIDHDVLDADGNIKPGDKGWRDSNLISIDKAGPLTTKIVERKFDKLLAGRYA